MQPSKPMSLNSADYKKALRDAAYFFIVPLTFYLTAVLGVIQLPDHIISFADFIPTNSTIIAIVSWGISQILNLLRKYVY